MRMLARVVYSFTFLALLSCGGGGGGGGENTSQPDTQPRSSIHDGLSDEILDRIALNPPEYLPLEQIILPDGQTLADYRASPGYVAPVLNPSKAVASLQAPLASPVDELVTLKKKMIDASLYYACGQALTVGDQCEERWKYNADPNDPVHAPAQTALLYVYGGKTPLVRTAGEAPCDVYRLHGLDCSGLMQHVAAAAGITVEGNAANQVIPKSWVVPGGTLEMAPVLDGTYQAGDILGWINGEHRHIGIAYSSGANPHVISSLGYRSKCLINMDSKHGPISYRLNGLAMGAPTHVLRLQLIPTDLAISIQQSPVTSHGVPVRFSAVLNNAPISPETHSIAWTFHDRTTSTSATPQKSYVQPGQYSVNLTLVAKDSDGQPTGKSTSYTKLFVIPIVGEYKGTFNGSATGTVSLFFDDLMKISGSATVSSEGDTKYTLVGLVSTDGVFEFRGTDAAELGTFTGKFIPMDGKWSISGTWTSLDHSEAGAFSAIQVVAP